MMSRASRTRSQAVPHARAEESACTDPVIALGMVAGELLHEINNAFTTVKRQCDDALKLASSDVVAQALKSSSSTSERLKSITEALLASVRQEHLAGRSECCAYEVVQQAKLCLDPERRAEVRVEGDSARRAEVPGVLLEHVLINLLLNAVASSSAGDSILITIDDPKVDGVSSSWNMGRRYLELAVCDRGEGFQRRGRETVAPRRYGLSVCKRLLAAVGGSLIIGPAPDGGTLARVLIPCGDSTPASQKREAA